jgi:hypothetical protein
MEKGHWAVAWNPAGGVIGPILANLFLHYAFDLWMARTHPDLPWCRYADDGLVHCRTEQKAEANRAELQARLEVCGLQMHPTKTKIVYCKDYRRRRTYPNVKFDFLGYQFRPRRVATSQRTEFSCGYTPAVSPTALKSMRATIRSLHIPDKRRGRWLRSPGRSIRSSWVDRLLRTVQPFGAVHSGQLRQSQAEGVDNAKVRALPVPQNPSLDVLAKVGGRG